MSDKERSERALEEVNLMNKSFNGLFEDREVRTDPPTTDVPVETDAPVTDEPDTEIPSTDAPATDKPATDTPATDAPTTDIPDERDQTIADLRAKLAEKDSGPKPTDTPTTSAPLSLESQDFIGDEDVESLTKESLNKLLNSVYSKGVTDSRNIINEGVAKTVPSLVTNQISMATEMKEIKDNFYGENEDLKPFPKVVSAVFEDLAKENPTETFINIIKSVAPEVRKRLNLPEQKIKQKSKSDKGNPPNLPRKRGNPGRTTHKPGTSPIETELDAMNEVLGR